MQVQEGEGWRWLVDPARHPFSVLVGGPGWAVELTAAEAGELQRGLLELLREHRALAAQLMPQEVSSGWLWRETWRPGRCVSCLPPRGASEPWKAAGRHRSARHWSQP